MLNVTGRSNRTTYRPVSAKLVHHRAVRDRDVRRADNLAGRVDDDVLDEFEAQ